MTNANPWGGGMDEAPGTCFDCDGFTHEEWRDHTFPYGAKGARVELTARIPVDVCRGCGSASLGHRAEVVLHEAVCAHLDVLNPREVRAVRERHKLSRAAFAELTCLGKATLHRWEHGLLIQNRGNDRYLRLLRSAQNIAALRRLAAAPRSPWEPDFRFRSAALDGKSVDAGFPLQTAA